MRRRIFKNTSDVFDHELRFRCLARSLVRYVVEKYGGTVETNPQTKETRIAVPCDVEDACMEELRHLLEYAYS